MTAPTHGLGDVLAIIFQNATRERVRIQRDHRTIEKREHHAEQQVDEVGSALDNTVIVLVIYYGYHITIETVILVVDVVVDVQIGKILEQLVRHERPLLNATIGIATEGGEAMHLRSVHRQLADVAPDDAYPRTAGYRDRLRKLPKD